jgi:hypothetical protein
MPPQSDIVDAEYAAPTSRYPHGVLGDRIEWGALILTHPDGSQTRHDLAENAVFEDLSPRLADVDGDGSQEVIVVEADARLGAQLAIYDASGKIAATPHIGTRFRWLAPIAAHDLDGDGVLELAYIETPHLGKTLRIWRMQEGALEEVAALRGLTNHRIGEDFITSTLRVCGSSSPALVTVDARWQRIVFARLTEGQIITEDAGPFEGLESVVSLGLCE